MGNKIRICTDRRPTGDRHYEALCCSLRENPANHPLGIAALNLPTLELARAAATSRWAPGRTLKIRFDSTSRKSERKVVRAAIEQWTAVANLKIVESYSGPSDLRCGFNPGLGSWSYVGTDNLAIPQTEPTMNLGWIDEATALHEVGHALGLIHEHQNPLAAIPWNRQACYRYFGGPPNFWTPEDVDAQVLRVYTGPLTNGGFDPKSIMLYAIPAELLTDPSRATSWNRELSDGDKAFVRGIYPG